ncbi:MAG: OsmC family protein [Actinomycetota bacterium]|nr:OsmC family protein [Actinomycetota bacterium]
MVKVAAKRRSGLTHDVEIEGGHGLVFDEPLESGGNDKGPSPVRVLGASLAACTAITMEMYAERKDWDLGAVEVEVEIEYDRHTPKSFTVRLGLPDGLDDEQRERLRIIAGKCPVHKSLSVPVTIV